MTEKFDLLIQGGVVVTGAGMTRADVAVRGETIAAVGPNLPAEGARRVVDAAGKFVLPGAIDAHTHPVYLDNIQNTSITAAFGGTTTIIHYAYARPGDKVVESIEKFRDDGLTNAITDFGLHIGMFDTANQMHDLPKAFDLGVTSFKVFMTYAKLKWMTDDYWLMALLDMMGQEGGLVAVHAESGLATDYLQDKYNRLNMSALEVYTATRPDVLEAEAINRAIAMAKVADCALYIAHVTPAKGLAPIRRAKQEGQVVYAETCPQYLTLTDQVLQKLKARAKVGPPIRTAKDNAGLWRGLQDGTIDVVASDHAAKPKEIDDDFFEAAYGSPQAETLLTVTYNEGVNRGHIGVPRLVQVLCETPAKIFGYYPKKGTIAPGSDADVVLFDPFEPWTIRHANQHSKANYTAYEGRECLGRAVWVMQRGRVLIEDGQLVAAPGQAKYLPTKTAVNGI